MSTREELNGAVDSARAALTTAEAALADFDSKAENNVFSDLKTAAGRVEGMLESRAAQDCEGRHNCGLDEYTQEFMVDGVKYIGTLKCEYNRHDKTYYYIEESSFSYAPATV